MLRSVAKASSSALRRIAFSAGRKLITPAMSTAISPGITKPDLAELGRAPFLFFQRLGHARGYARGGQAFSPSEGEEADFSEGDRDSEDVELDEEDIFDDEEGDDDLVSEEEEDESD